MTLAIDLSNKGYSVKRLRFFFIASLLGVIANGLAITLPFVVPLMLGNVAFFVLLIKLGPLWAFVSLLLVCLPVNTALFWMMSLVQFACLALFRHQIEHLNKALLGLFAAVTLPVVFLLQQALWFGLVDFILVFGLLLLNFIVIVRGTEFIVSLSVRQANMKNQALREQISRRIAIYSAVPSTIFISLILNSATSLHFASFTEQHLATQENRVLKLADMMSGYSGLLQMAARTLDELPMEKVLSLLVNSKTEFISALTTDQDGNLTAFYIDNPEFQITRYDQLNVSHRDYFINTAKSRQTTISDSFIGQPFGRHNLFAVSYPLERQQAFAGIIQVAISLERFDQLFGLSDRPEIISLLLDRNQNVIWQHANIAPLGKPYTQLDFQPLAKSSPISHLGVSLSESLYIDQQAHKLVLKRLAPATQWLFIDKVDIDEFSHLYQGFLLLALLLVFFILEFISRISGVFAKQYTASLEQLAEYAASWHAEENTNRPVPELHATSIEFESLRQSLSHLHYRVIESQKLLKTALQQRISLNNELEQRVQIRTAELASERDNAQKLATIKTRFLANMSHEIRTPLTIISGFLEQLRAESNLAPPLRETLQLIASNTEHLQHVVNDILDTAKIDEGKLAIRPEPVPLAPFLQQQLVSFRPLALQKQLRFELDLAADIPPAVIADPFRMAQILNNLLSNALKFTAEGSITMQAKLDTDGLRLRVIDTGIGIKPEQQDHLFGAFAQADISTSRRFGGTGLGLHISQSLANLQGMQLSYRPNIPQGSCFELWLPRSLFTEALPNQPGGAADSLHPDTAASTTWQFSGKILIVDDVAEIRLLIKRQLASTGAQLLEAADGYQALHLAAIEQPDLIILDQQMPGIDGIETAKQLVANGYHGKLLSLSADVYDQQQLQQQSIFDTILAKPVKQQVLVQTLANLLRNTQQELVITTTSDTSTEAEIDPELAQLQQEYLAAQQALPSQLQQYLAAADYAQLARVSHQIKGTAACLELTSLNAAAVTLQQLVKNALANPDSRHYHTAISAEIKNISIILNIS